MKYFEKKETEYSDWIDAHPDGYVVNVHTSGRYQSIIHSARCHHLYPLDTGQLHTAGYPKACSDDRSELERWARENGHDLRDCPDCDN